MIKVTVSLQTKLEKSPFYYAVLHWIDPIKKDQYKWKSTKVRYVDEKQKRLHNKAEQEAENKAEEIRKTFEEELNKTSIDKRQEILFTDYLKDWLTSVSNVLAETTIGGYQSNINSIIFPYFEPKKIKLSEITTLDLQDFYDQQYKLGKSARTVLHYHNNIHEALDKARKTKLIVNNPADDCQLQRPKQYIPQIYNSSELKAFLEKIADTDIEIPVMIASFYGLRREEVLGLKWNRVDFENNTITIAHVVTVTTINKKRVVVKKDIPKNNPSYRTFPLMPIIRDYLAELKVKQEENKKIFKNSYKNDENYVCVNIEGKLIEPDFLTRKFPKFLKENNFRKIRFHDLRHSVGSMLISKTSLRQVQEWLRTLKCFNNTNLYTP